MKYKKRGFTLIELLIVIGIIAILAAAVIVAINPGQQFAQARDGARESHINTLYNALISYQISSGGNWGELSSEVTPGFDEICNTNLEPSNCDGLADLSDLAESGHINQIPVDPQGGVSETADGTGYFIAQGSVMLVAANYETRFISVGITQTEYAGTDNGEEGENGDDFSCGDELVDDRGEETETYATVEIGTQFWMAEDLRYECENYVDTGSSTDAPEGWSDEPRDMCADANDAGVDYGNVVYQWDAAMKGSTAERAQGVCPNGWYIPAEDDWVVLRDWLVDEGYEDVEGEALKDSSIDNWCCDDEGWFCEPNDVCGEIDFLGVPGGMRDSGDSDGELTGVGSYSRWFSSTQTDDGEGNVFVTDFSLATDFSALLGNQNEEFGNSIRCLKE